MARIPRETSSRKNNIRPSFFFHPFKRVQQKKKQVIIFYYYYSQYTFIIIIIIIHSILEILGIIYLQMEQILSNEITLPLFSLFALLYKTCISLKFVICTENYCPHSRRTRVSKHASRVVYRRTKNV